MRELHGVRIPMRDGVELVADVFVPLSAEPRPLILEVMPYTRGREVLNFSSEAPYWIEHGYAFAIVDARGQGDSMEAGPFELWLNEGRDCHDVIEWLAMQSYCNGRIGMRGASYSGTNQWFAARERPPHLRAIVPNASGTGGFDDIVYPGGALHFRWALTWFSHLSDAKPNRIADVDWQALLDHRPVATADEVAAGRTLRGYRTLCQHPTRDEHMRKSELSDSDYAAIDLPVLSFSGWFDGTLRGTLEHFQRMRKLSPAQGCQWLVIGPWEHGPCSEGGYDYTTGKPIEQVGDYRVPVNGLFPGQEVTRRFYDAWLKDGPQFERPHASLFLTGSNVWVHADDYPPRSMKPQPLYLHSGGGANGLAGDGTLSFTAADDEAADGYTFNPTRPVPSDVTDASSGRALAVPTDLATLIDRDDVLVYLSGPFEEAITICGDVEVKLFIASDAIDTDFFARIEDVSPDGRGLKLGCRNAGVLQARSRAGFDRETFLIPGKPAEMRIPLFGIGHTFLAGHRIRLSVTSSSYPEIFPNPNTGLPRSTDTSVPRMARQTIFHDRERPSALVLPVIPTPNGAQGEKCERSAS